MVIAQSIDIAAGEGRAIFAHLAVPDAGSGPGLVLFHDLSDDDGGLRELCEFYAEEGYLVLCPKAFAVARGAGDVVTAVAALRGRAECTGKVGALGFGLGGKLACLAAAEAGGRLRCVLLWLRHRFWAQSCIAHKLPDGVRIFAEKDPQIPPDSGGADRRRICRPSR